MPGTNQFCLSISACYRNIHLLMGRKIAIISHQLTVERINMLSTLPYPLESPQSTYQPAAQTRQHNLTHNKSASPGSRRQANNSYTISHNRNTLSPPSLPHAMGSLSSPYPGSECMVAARTDVVLVVPQRRGCATRSRLSSILGVGTASWCILYILRIYGVRTR